MLSTLFELVSFASNSCTESSVSAELQSDSLALLESFLDGDKGSSVHAIVLEALRHHIQQCNSEGNASSSTTPAWAIICLVKLGPLAVSLVMQSLAESEKDLSGCNLQVLSV